MPCSKEIPHSKFLQLIFIKINLHPIEFKLPYGDQTFTFVCFGKDIFHYKEYVKHEGNDWTIVVTVIVFFPKIIEESHFFFVFFVVVVVVVVAFC